MKDLILLVADKNMQLSLQGGLNRPESLGIRQISFDFRQHPGRDGGTRSNGAQLLALEKTRFSHALLVFDFEGCGAGTLGPLDLEALLDQQIAAGISLARCEDAAFCRLKEKLQVWFPR